MDDSVDLMNRPARLVRITIVIAAIACLGLTMCVRADHKAPSQPTPTPAMRQQPPTQQAAPPQQAAKPKPKRDPEYFNATKAPGDLYR